MKIEERPRRVMIVDDNVDAAEMLAIALETRGYTTVIAHDATTALSLASSFVPTVACLDIGLPSMDGCQLAQRLHALPHWGGVRLIAITGYGMPADRVRTRQAGIECHLVKPVDLETLVRVLEGPSEPG